MSHPDTMSLSEVAVDNDIPPLPLPRGDNLTTPRGGGSTPVLDDARVEDDMLVTDVSEMMVDSNCSPTDKNPLDRVAASSRRNEDQPDAIEMTAHPGCTTRPDDTNALEGGDGEIVDQILEVSVGIKTLAKQQRKEFHQFSGGQGAISLCYEVAAKDENGVNHIRFSPGSITLTVGDALQFQWASHMGIQEYNPNGEKVVSRVVPKIDQTTMVMTQDQSDNAVEHVSQENGVGLGCEATKGGSHLVKFQTAGHYVFRSFCPTAQQLQTEEAEMGIINVHVKTKQDKLARTNCCYLAGGLLALAILCSLIVVAVYIVDSMFLFVPADTNDSAQYKGARELQSLLMIYAVPWIVLGLMLFLILVIVRIVVLCMPTHLQDYGRGFSLTQHTMCQVVQLLVIIVPLFGIICAFWYYLLAVNYGWSQFFAELTNATLQVLNEIFSIIQNIKFLITQMPTLFPNIIVPGTAQKMLTQVQNIATLVQTYATNGEAIVRGLFRLLAVLTFLGLQFALVACAFGIVAVFLKKAKLMRTAVWLMAFSLSLNCIAIGATWFNLKMMERTADTLEAFSSATLSATDLQVATASTKSAPHIELFGFCAPGALDVSFLGVALDGITDSWNTKASGTNDTLSSNASSSVVNLTTLLKYTDFMVMQLDVLESKLKANPGALEKWIPNLTNKTAPALRAVLSATQSVVGLVDCTVLRSTIAAGIPSLRKDVLAPLQVQLNLHLCVFVWHIIFCLSGFVCSYVFARELKTFYDGRSNRWFRFEASWNAHKAILAHQSPEAQAELVPLKSDFTLFGVLGSFHSINLGNATTVALNAVVLAVLHFSYKENQLGFQLKVVCFLCLLAPFCCFPAEYFQGLSLRVLCRVSSVIVLLVAFVLAMEFTTRSAQDSEVCFNEIQARHRNASNGTQYYPFSDECNVDTIVRKVEFSVYAAIIGISCLIATFTALVMLGTIHLRNQLPILEEDTPNVVLREIRRRKAAKKTGIVVGGCAFLLTTLVVGVVLLSMDEPIQLQSMPKQGFYRLDPKVGCNGNTHLCGKRFQEIAWTTSHNAMATADDSFFSPNHYYNFHDQLQAGVRGFMIDVFPALSNATTANTSSELQLCHANCDLGGYQLSHDLVYARKFLQQNSTNVIFFLVENYVSTTELVEAFELANMTDFMWSSTTTPESSGGSFMWPTLQEQIDAGQQIMLFTDTSVDHTSKSSGGQGHPFWVHYMWDFFYENAFDNKELSDFQCKILRGKSTSTTDYAAIMASKATVLNHFLTNPVGAPYLSTEANRPLYLRDHYEQCKTEWAVGRVNAIAVDFWSLQSPLRTVNCFNGDRASCQ